LKDEIRKKYQFKKFTKVKKISIKRTRSNLIGKIIEVQARKTRRRDKKKQTKKENVISTNQRSVNYMNRLGREGTPI